jgi:secondary thiamine-phosphate synthase enzyme
MATYHETIPLDTRAGVQTIDITDRVVAAIGRSGVRDGLACVFSPSSTSALIANEAEAGLMKDDLPGALERLVPASGRYAHNAAWGEENGHSHVRSMLLGASLTLPVVEGAAALGTWQQIVFVELDTKPRKREVVVQVVGERTARSK